jgi:hypothetical protein
MEYFRSMGSTTMQPTQYSFATVISAWSRCGSKSTESGERAEYILERMKSFRKTLSREKGNEEYIETLSPDTVVYNCVIDAWSKSGNPIASTKAERLFTEMDDICSREGKACPDTITFNSLINCHANSRHINSAKAAEKVLMKMEAAAKIKANVVPNTLTYNHVLKAYAHSQNPGAANRADTLLRYMIQSNNKATAPDVISFSTCVDVWAKSKEKGKAVKAYAILQKMIEFNEIMGMKKLRPNEFTYNTCLNACAFSAHTEEGERKQALKIAVTLFNEMQKSNTVKPDSISFGMLLKCFANLMPKGSTRDNMTSKIFTKCRNDGLVNDLVFNEAHRAASPKLMRELLTGSLKKNSKKKRLNELQLRDLPYEWKANVKEKRKQVKQKSKTGKNKKSKGKVKDEKETAPQFIRPMRRITETSWQSGRDV